MQCVMQSQSYARDTIEMTEQIRTYNEKIQLILMHNFIEVKRMLVIIRVCLVGQSIGLFANICWP